MSVMKGTRLVYQLTAQPIHEDGSLGFEDRSPLFLEADTLAEVFELMASEDGNDGDCGLGAYVEKSNAWDLTLTIREVSLAERVGKAMGGRDRFPAACPECGWDAGGELEVVDRYATDFPPIPYMDLREVVADPGDGPVAECRNCGAGLDPDSVAERRS